MVVIEQRPERLEDAAAEGYIGLRGDATREAALREAGVRVAKAVLVCLSRDDATVLTVLTARSLNEGARILASVMDEENLKLVRKAGADEVVSPGKIAGFLLADAVNSRYTTRFISDILSARGGQLRIAERKAVPDEIGQRMCDVPGRLIVALDARHDERFRNFKSVSLYAIKSLLCVPMRYRGKILGTVYVDSRREGKFIYYRVSDPRVRQILALARGVIADNAAAIVSCTRM